MNNGLVFHRTIKIQKYAKFNGKEILFLTIWSIVAQIYIADQLY